MKDQCRPHKDQDIAEAPAQVCRGQRQLFQDQLPADRVETEDQDSQTEPGDLARGEKRIFSAELETGGSQALHEHGDDCQKDDIASFT